MPKPTYTPDTQNIFMGPAILEYDGKVLGATVNDSIKINYTQTTTPLQTDQSALPLKEYVTSVECSVEAELADTSAASLANIIGADATGFKDPMGIDMLAAAKELKVYPLDVTDTRVFVFPKAAITMNGVIGFSRTTPTSLPISIKCYLESAGGYAMKIETEDAGA